MRGAERDLLCVLNPRCIPSCLDAIEALPIDIAWLTGYTEESLAGPFRAVLHQTKAEQVYVLSDDVIPSEKALEAVRGLAEEHPVVTGYCNLDQTDERVNLTKTPLVRDDPPVLSSYGEWYKQSEVQELTRSYFAGMCLTGMSTELWRQFPLETYWQTGGRQSDYSLSLRLQEAGLPIVTTKDAWTEHLKTLWNVIDTDPIKRLRIGEIRPQIHYGNESPFRSGALVG